MLKLAGPSLRNAVDVTSCLAGAHISSSTNHGISLHWNHHRRASEPLEFECIHK
jgi:hypothetical protein